MSVRNTDIDPKLILSARKEFLEHGFLRADLKTICENAGVTTGAVYKRFRGKEELFCAVVEELVQKLDEFLDERSEVDFSTFSDDEIRASWTMTYEAMMPIFELLMHYRDDFIILTDRCAGTRYETFKHDYVVKMSFAYEDFYKEIHRRGLTGINVTREEFHVLLSSFWTCICEPIIHGMEQEEIEEHCRVMCRFFDWAGAVGMK